MEELQRFWPWHVGRDSQGTGSFEIAIDTLGQALAIAQRDSDIALEINTLTSIASANWLMRLDLQGTLENALRAIELDRSIGHIQFAHDAHWYAVMSLMALGDLERARSHADAHLSTVERAGVHISLAQALHANETIAHAQGDW